MTTLSYHTSYTLQLLVNNPFLRLCHLYRLTWRLFVWRSCCLVNITGVFRYHGGIQNGRHTRGDCRFDVIVDCTGLLWITYRELIVTERRYIFTCHGGIQHGRHTRGDCRLDVVVYCTRLLWVTEGWFISTEKREFPLEGIRQGILTISWPITQIRHNLMIMIFPRWH